MKFFEEIPEYLIEWMLKQQMFWVASAPLSPDGHVNISPKGIEGTFHIVNSRRVWYEDLSGTGMRSVSTEHYYPLTIYFRCWNCLPYTGERSHYHSFSCIRRPSSDCTTLRKRFADFLLYPPSRSNRCRWSKFPYAFIYVGRVMNWNERYSVSRVLARNR